MDSGSAQSIHWKTHWSSVITQVSLQELGGWKNRRQKLMHEMVIISIFRSNCS